MRTQRQLFRLSQKALFYDPESEKYLILKVAPVKEHHPSHKFWMKKYGPWDLPGGHVDAVDESDLFTAFAREIKEETGITLTACGDICHTEVMHNKQAQYPGLNHIYYIPYIGEIVLSPEHTAYEWMSADDIAKHKEVKSWIKDSVAHAELLRERNGSLNSWKRCLADFDNYKKRQSESQKEFIAYAAEGVITDMLPVLDNFHAATDHIPENERDNPWVTGVMYIQQQMEKVLEEKGVTKMNIQIGDDFDPHTMDAVKNDENMELDEGAVVAKVAQPGYKIGPKVLRPARVAVTTKNNDKKEEVKK
jgi:molecular chaperone GrpE